MLHGGSSVTIENTILFKVHITIIIHLLRLEVATDNLKQFIKVRVSYARLLLDRSNSRFEVFILNIINLFAIL